MVVAAAVSGPLRIGTNAGGDKRVFIRRVVRWNARAAKSQIFACYRCRENWPAAIALSRTLCWWLRLRG